MERRSVRDNIFAFLLFLLFYHKLGLGCRPRKPAISTGCPNLHPEDYEREVVHGKSKPNENTNQSKFDTI